MKDFKVILLLQNIRLYNGATCYTLTFKKLSFECIPCFSMPPPPFFKAHKINEMYVTDLTHRAFLLFLRLILRPSMFVYGLDRIKFLSF